MTMPALNADAFKKVACAIHPYIQEMAFAPDAPDCIDCEIRECVRVAHETLASGGTLEVFCRQMDAPLLLSVCEFCKDKWYELRLRELGLG